MTAAIMKRHTPGPWDWFVRRTGEVYLATPRMGHLIVMDFVRFGMQSAQPRFAVWKGDERENMGGIMVPAVQLPGAGMSISDHPDARLMKAAPALLEACELVLRLIDTPPQDPLSLAADKAIATGALRDAVATAKGGAQ